MIDETRLCELFRLAATALCGSGTPSNYDRRRWASKRYAQENQGVSSTKAYKALCRMDAWRLA